MAAPRVRWWALPAILSLGWFNPVPSQPVYDWIGSLTFHNGGMLTTPREAASANGVLKVSLGVDAFRMVRALGGRVDNSMMDIIFGKQCNPPLSLQFPGELHQLHNESVLF